MSPAPAGTGPGPGPAKPPSSPYAGRTIARCKVGERLGRGATSHVFRAHYEPLGKDIALKILSGDAAGSADMRARFLSEARAAGKLSNENIVKVLDVAEDQGFLCILMELVEGQTLQDRLDDEKVLPPRHALSIAAQMARALEAAHEADIVHRDVKPANVMLLGRPGEETVKVVDFGLAAQQELNRVGTPLFMSPEAAQGKRIDEKSDVYAMGVCLYRMLTGTLPFTGTTVKEILAAHVNAELVPPSRCRQQLGAVYDDLLKKLLVKSKGYRPSAGEAAEILEDLADDLEEREKGVRRVRRRKKRAAAKQSKPVNPAVLATFAVVGVVVVIGAMLMSSGKPAAPTQGGQGDPPPVAAIDPAKKAYDEIESWVGQNSGKLSEAAAKWRTVENSYPGTPWATRAAANRVAVEEALKQKQEAAKTAQAKAPVTAAQSESARHAHVAQLVKDFNFREASSLLEEMDAPSGTSRDEWNQHCNRIDYLGRHWVDAMDKGVRALRSPLKAKDVFPSARDNETIVGANSAGAVVSDGNQKVTVSWSEAAPEAFFKSRVIVDRVLDTNDFDANVILASLAAELNQLESMRRYRSNAQGLAGEDESHTTTIRSLFGK
jgi:tRNA A-37 threonylcarbamoyl transferase component Bud32